MESGSQRQKNESADETPLGPIRRALRLRFGLLASIGLMGLVIALFVYMALDARERRWIEAQFRYDSELRTNLIEREFGRYLDLLSDLSAYLDLSSPAVDESRRSGVWI